MRRAWIAWVGVLALAGCTNSNGSDGSTETVSPDISEVVSATSTASVLAFSVDIASSSTVLLSTAGVLDVPEVHGFRSDSAGIDGAGLEPLGRVWLEDGEQFQSVDDDPAEPAYGGLANFLSINDPQDPTSLDEVIGRWLESAEPLQVTQERIQDVVLTRFRLDRTERPPLEIWIDSAHRLVRVIEVGDQIRPLTATYAFEYPDTVSIPARP